MRSAPAATRWIFACCRPSGSEGHWLAETDGGEKIYGPALDSAMKAIADKAGEGKR